MVQILKKSGNELFGRDLGKLQSRQFVVNWSKLAAVLLPAIAVAAMPWAMRNSQAAMPAGTPVLKIPPVLLSGHVFAHGCSPVSASLNGNPIRVGKDGNFSVAVRAPRHAVSATFEFTAPGCHASIKKLDLRPGIMRYGMAASLFPHFALQQRSRRPKSARVGMTLANSTERRLPRQLWAVADLVEQYATETGLDPALVFAVVHTESNFDTHAHSRANAVGLMQLVPHLGASDAARFLSSKSTKVSKASLRDPATNLRLGTAYLQLLMERYYGDVSNRNVRRSLALAAYNWGPGNMQSAIHHQGRMPVTQAEVKTLLHRYAPPETQRYVDKVMRRMAWYEQVI